MIRTIVQVANIQLNTLRILTTSVVVIIGGSAIVMSSVVVAIVFTAAFGGTGARA
jgi:hypothetical protein